MNVIPGTPQGIRVTPIARMAQGGSWRVEAMRSYSSDMLLWITRGQGRITISGRTRGFGAHNAIYIPAGTMHGFEMMSSVFGTAAFFPKNLDLDLYRQPLHFRVRDAIPQGELTNILESLQRELTGNQDDSSRAAYHHAGLFAVWLDRARQMYASDVDKTSRSADLVARYTDMIEEEFRSGRAVADFARALNITPTHLSRVCNQVCGRSASAILKDRVLYEARRLLCETRLPVNQVAAQLGFTSAAYFSRAFLTNTGQTPSAFRRAQ